MKKKALGRGLRSLIPELPAPIRANQPAIVSLKVSEIRRNASQPREHMNPATLQELAESIKTRGLIQPIVVQRRPQGYELIAGERRLRAVQSLGYEHIPAIVREEISDRESLELSLLENIQRDNLNPVEEARAYHRLSQEFALTQETIAQVVGKDRSTVANALRLLKLPSAMLEALRSGALSLGHAKALLGASDAREQQRLFDELLRRGGSVREIETRVARRAKRGPAVSRARDPEVVTVEDELAKALGTRVRIVHGRRRGRIVIDYYSLEDLERIRHVIHTPRLMT